MSEEQITAGQYYLPVIGTAQAALNNKSAIAQEEYDKLLNDGLKPLVLNHLRRYGVYTDDPCVEVSRCGWRDNTFSITLRRYEEDEETVGFNITVDGSSIPPRPDDAERRRAEARASVFRGSRKQSVDQFIKYVRLKVGGIKRTVSEFDALWDAWIDYLVATNTK